MIDLAHALCEAGQAHASIGVKTRSSATEPAPSTPKKAKAGGYVTKNSPQKPTFFKPDEQHLPIRVRSDARGECYFCRQGLNGEKRCMKSAVKCSSCGVHLCLEVDRNCFMTFHELHCAKNKEKTSRCRFYGLIEKNT